jgi:hypothetical protein
MQANRFSKTLWINFILTWLIMRDELLAFRSHESFILYVCPLLHTSDDISVVWYAYLQPKFTSKLENITKCGVVRVTKLTCSSSDDWIY